MSHQSDLDNHANQLNQNNDEYWHSRGLGGPDDHDDGHDEPYESSRAGILISLALNTAMPVAAAAAKKVASAYFRRHKND